MGNNGGMNHDPTATPPALAKNEHNLVWIDCEMSGLDPERERLLEVAIVVTGPQLWPVVHGPVVVVHQSDTLLSAMDAWNTGTHTRSGLVDKVRQSPLSEAQAESVLLDFMRQYVPERASPMCGNTIGQDRRFLVKYMPELEAFFHYRSIDVSTIKELAARWRPSVLDAVKKNNMHQALEDVRESIHELRVYRDLFFRLED